MNLQTQIELMKDPSRFSRLVILLLGEEYQDYQAVDDSRGDGGNDGYLLSEKRMFARHCFEKPEKQKNDRAILTKLRSDFAKAVKRKRSGDYDVENWTFITNYALPDHIIKTMRDMGKSEGISSLHKGADYVARLALKHKHILSEFPELEHIDMRAEIHERFDDIENKLPQQPNEQSQVIGDVRIVLHHLLIQLTLYGEYEVNPYVAHVDQQMAVARDKIEDKLGSVARLFGEDSNWYKQLGALSDALHGAITTERVIGLQSHNERMGHTKKSLAITQRLLQDIGEHLTIEDLENTKADLQRKILRWFEGFDSSYSAFFNYAEDYASRLMNVYSYLYQTGEDEESEQYSRLAKDIYKLSQDDRSGFGTVLDEEIPKLVRRTRLLGLTKAEVELLTEAVEHTGQIHEYHVDQTPPGFFVGVGSKKYASDTDASVARPYMEALNTLQDKGLVEHTSGNLFTVTAEGRRKVGKP